MKQKINECIDLIKTSKNTVVLTGAGMSTESGIPDFRSEDGIYKMVPEKVLSYQYFLLHPDEFYKFLKKYFAYSNVPPNIGHKILAQWENKSLIKRIITQNIDELHQKAGNQNVLEVHGKLGSATCQNPQCSKKYNIEDILEQDAFYCSCKHDYGVIKPDVVLFDEPVSKINDAYNLVKDADLLMVLGSSLMVYPVASLPLLLDDDKHMIIVNKEPTQFDNRDKCVVINDSVGKTLDKINEGLTE